MIAFIESLKDDTCTPKPAKLNAWVVYIHICSTPFTIITGASRIGPAISHRGIGPLFSGPPEIPMGFRMIPIFAVEMKIL